MADVTTFDPVLLERRQLAALLNGLVAPRPVAWISSESPAGVRNLAPFSYFNAFSTVPATVAVGPGSRQGVEKDTLANIRATGEFVVNVVTRELAEHANATSAECAGDVDEWEIAGLTPAPSELVRPARIAESPAALECRVVQIVDLSATAEPTNAVVIAAVLRIHVASAVLDGFAPDPDLLPLVGRMGGDLWSGTGDRFELRRPASADPAEVRAALAEARPDGP